MCWGGRGTRQARCLAGKVTWQAKPVKPLCAGGAGCQAGKVARQARPPGKQGRQAGEAGQSVM